MTSYAQPTIARPALLRRAIQADAIIVAASAVALVAANGAIASFSGIPASALLAAGLFFLPYAALLWWVSTRPTISRRVGWALMLVNVLWVFDSAALLVLNWLPLTNAGWWLVVAQAIVVATIAELQYMGLRQMQATDR